VRGAVNRPSTSGYVTAAALVAATVGVVIWILATHGPGAPSRSQLDRLRSAATAAHCSLARFPSEGREHTTGPVHYRTNPPTSGPHNPVPAPDRVYTVAPRPENYVHSLEHGRIELQYRPDAPPAVRDALRRVLEESTHHMLLFPNNTGMGFEVAATAWKHRIGCARFNAKVPEALGRFRDAFRDRAPEQVP
jgi:Protein of unknown function (DUF3105)